VKSNVKVFCYIVLLFFVNLTTMQFVLNSIVKFERHMNDADIHKIKVSETKCEVQTLMITVFLLYTLFRTVCSQNR